MQDINRTEAEAAVFRHLIKHLQDHTEVQNIELMILADFCRNCLAKWYVAAVEEQGGSIDYQEALEIVYGMLYSEWKEKFQHKATPQQLAAFEQRQKNKAAS